MEWISVEDRLPKQDEYVAVYMPKMQQWMQLGFYCNGVFVDNEGYTLRGSRTPTHWMPWPPPPQEGE